MNITTFIAVFLLIIGLSAQCSPHLALAGVEAGTIEAGLQSSNLLLNPSSNQLDYLYPYKTSLRGAPQVAFALSAFQGTRIIGFAFQMVLIQSSTTGLRTRLVTPWEITRWSSLRFAVLINTRSDLEVGTYNPQSKGEVYIDWESSNRQIIVPFSKKYNNSAQLVARPYLSGIYIDISSMSLSLQMMQISIGESSFTVGVVSDSPIKGIYVSYFVFSPSTAAFVSYGGIASQPSISGTIFQTVQMSLNSPNNNFFGITGFSFSNSVRVSLSSSIDSKFILNTTGNSFNTTVSFIVIGNNPNTVCSECPGTIPSYDRCVQGCGAEQVMFNYLGAQNKGCVDCPSYAFLRPNQVGTDCICQEGYSIVRGACIPTIGGMQSGSTFANMTAEALQTQFFNTLSGVGINTVTTTTTQTINIQNQNLNINQNQKLTCPDPNSYLSNNNCYCLPGFFLINGNCNKCPDGTYYNGSICLAVAQQTQTTQQQSQIQGQTQSQILTQQNNQIVNPTFQQTTSSSLPVSINPPNTIINPSQNPLPMMIPSQTNSNDVQVIHMPSGGDPSIFFPPGLVPDNVIIIINQTTPYWNNCNECFNWEGHFNPKTKVCPMFQYLASPRNCICIPGYKRNQKGYCIPDYDVFPCTMRNAYINGDGYCVCPPGMAFNMNYQCVNIDITIICPVGGFLQPDGTCICISPFVNSNGVCILCRNGLFWNGVACVLSCPINRIFNPTTMSCVCEGGYVEDKFSSGCIKCPQNSIPYNNYCVYCPPYSVRQGNRCVCIKGAELKNNVCQPICPPRSYYDLATLRCICFDQNNFINSANICVPCPTGRYYDGTACIPCTLPSWFDYFLRVCRYCNPPFFQFNQQCVRCPDNSYWNPLLRRCECNAGYSVRNGVCQLNPDCPNGRIVNGYCVICRNGQIVNNACICLPGFEQVVPGLCLPICIPPERRNRNGLCVTCPINSIWDPNTLDCVCNTAAGYIWSPTWGICILNCPPAISVFINGQCVCNEGYYPAPPPVFCVSCTSNCLRCTSTQCIECRPGWIRSGNLCIPTCGPGFYLLNNICVPCTPPCLTCSITGTNCTDCITGYTLIGNTCRPQCPQNSVFNVGLNMCVCIDGFYLSQNLCVRCPVTCLTCTSPTNCVICLNGRPPVNDQCNQCQGGAVWVNNQCVCPDRFYYNGTGCSPCMSYCLRCISATTCSDCILPRIFNATLAQCVCPLGMTVNILTQQCVCPARTYWDTTLRTCNQCPVNCLVCTSSTTCTICVNVLTPPVNGQCPTNPTCTPPQYSCLRGCCTCNVPNCLRCNYNIETICDQCIPPAVRNTLGQCVIDGCNPACPPGWTCFRGRCYDPNNNQFQITLISDIYSGVDRSYFKISILPAVTIFQQQFGNLATLNSRTFVSISFQGLTVRQIPAAYCQQEIANLANWDCIVPYYNQPIPVPYNMILTATSPVSSSLTAYLILTINPVQARSSITDATALMRITGSLLTITTMSNVVDAGVIRP